MKEEVWMKNQETLAHRSFDFCARSSPGISAHYTCNFSSYFMQSVYWNPISHTDTQRPSGLRVMHMCKKTQRPSALTDASSDWWMQKKLWKHASVWLNTATFIKKSHHMNIIFTKQQILITYHLHFYYCNLCD